MKAISLISKADHYINIEVTSTKWAKIGKAMSSDVKNKFLGYLNGLWYMYVHVIYDNFKYRQSHRGLNNGNTFGFVCAA